MKAKNKKAQFVTVGGKRLVILEEAEYERLAREAEEWEPALPAPGRNGNYPALETLDVLLARDIIRHRRKLGMSQGDLARQAGIPAKTLNEIEKGKRSPSDRILNNIEKALKKAEAKK
jgi:DNA-binding XRE family transcriptional regulator